VNLRTWERLRFSHQSRRQRLNVRAGVMFLSSLSPQAIDRQSHRIRRCPVSRSLAIHVELGFAVVRFSLFLAIQVRERVAHIGNGSTQHDESAAVEQHGVAREECFGSGSTQHLDNSCFKSCSEMIRPSIISTFGIPLFFGELHVCPWPGYVAVKAMARRKCGKSERSKHERSRTVQLISCFRYRPALEFLLIT
jgi:hypothetical protein